jgi:hypothetical protein
MLEIIKQLRSTTSRNAKEAILASHADNDDWKNYLIAVYNPFITYNKTGDKNELRDDLDNLKLCRSIDCGISAKTINKVYGNIIPTFGQQKALDYKNFKNTKKRKDTISFPCIAQYKYDGFSFTCIVDRDKPKFYTSGGHLFEIENSIFDNMAEGVYLGEMMGRGIEGKFGDRAKCGIQTTMRTNTAKGIKNWYEPNFRIFEYLSLEEFYAGKANSTYEYRWLYMFQENLDLDFELSSITADGRFCQTKEELDEFYVNAIADGWEGIVIRQPDHKWHNDGKRTDGLVKRKGRQSADLVCFDWKEGNGKFQGMIGSLGLRDKKGREVWVAPRTDADKQKDPDYYLGSIVEILYESMGANGSYNQPVFNGVRHDKAEGDHD